jgi:glycosyltransferase involved in cell wall biosynthesis
MINFQDRRVAIVHDEFTRRGGAEIVVENIIRLIPQATIFALYAGQPKIVVDGQERDINCTFLQKFPLWFRRHPRRLLLLLPHAVEQFDLATFGVVISSASGLCKGVITRVDVPHLCYCHTPTRYLWDATHDAVKLAWPGTRWLARLVFHYLRIVDYAAAQRVDFFVANSQFTQQRIATYYGRNSDVIYPPIDTAFFTPSPAENKNQLPRNEQYFLCVGRCNASKKFDQVIKVMRKLNYPLVIIGRGGAQKQWRKIAGKKTRFINQVSREELRRYYRQAKALVQPGIEDFGMATAESLACGTPVIAMAEGGAKEIVRHRETGVLYEDGSEESLAEAVRMFNQLEKHFKRELLQYSVLRFNQQNWEKAMEKKIQALLDGKSP